MKISQFSRCVGMILLGGMISLPAMAQVTVHLSDPSEQVNPESAPVDTVQKELELRKQLGVPAPTSRPSQEGFNGDYRQLPKGTISGTIITDDGSPVPNQINLQVSVRFGNGGGYGTGFNVSGGTFTQEVTAGTIYLYARAPGWAASELGPIEVPADQSVDELTLVLSHGRSIQVIVLDTEKKPIPGVTVNASVSMGQFGHSSNGKTDDQGLATLNDLPNTSPNISLTINAKGYQMYQGRVPADSDKPVTIYLGRAQPTVLTVLDLATNKPIKNARYYQEDPRMSWRYGREMEPYGISDDAGRLEVNYPNGQRESNGFIVTDDGRLELVMLPEGKKSDVIYMDAPITITGRVVGDLAKLPNAPRGMGKILNCQNQYARPQYGGMYGAEIMVPVTEKDGYGEFVISPVIPGTMTITKPNGSRITFNVDKSEKDLVIDLNDSSPTTHPATPPAAAPATPAAPGASSLLPAMPGLARLLNAVPVSGVMPLTMQIAMPATRMARPANVVNPNAAQPNQATKPVVLEFMPPKGVQKVQGWVGVQAYPRNGGRQIPMQWQEVKDNKVSFDLPDRCSAQFDLTQLPGLMARLEQVEIGNPDPNAYRGERYDQAGVSRDDKGTTTIRISPDAAGTIVCKVTDENGEPMSGLRPQILFAPNQNQPRSWRGETSSIEVTEEPGTYLLTDVPLGSQISVIVSGNYGGRAQISPLTRAVSDMLTLKPGDPTAQVEIKVPQGVEYLIQVVDDQDQPLPGIAVEYGVRSNNYSGGTSGMTDGLGQIVVMNVSMDSDSTFYVASRGGGGWRGEQVVLEKDQTTATLKLHRGLMLKGILLDEATGRPIVGAVMYAESRNNSPYGNYSRESAATNLRGEFQFDSLSPGDLSIQCNYVRLASSEKLFAAGNQEQRIVLKGRIQEGGMKFRLGKLPEELKAAAEKAASEPATHEPASPADSAAGENASVGAAIAVEKAAAAEKAVTAPPASN